MSLIPPDFIALQIALAGEYSLQRELGRGGMGVVYLARDVQLDRDVAIKVLPSHFAEQPSLRERFIREARTAAGLSHPNIVPIHRVGVAGGFVFFVMAYVPGRTLGEQLRADGPLAPAESMRIMREVAWALDYAHERGIIHRDIKPDNILLEAGTGRALVTDFGIARSSAVMETTPSDPGRVMGTAHFMSPEQAANQEIDGRSDLYALGVVGYVAVSGRLPFDAPNLPALMVRQATETPSRLAAVAPGVPAELGSAIDRCLSVNRDDRFTNGRALATALERRRDVEPPLPDALRAWLRARNPAYRLFIGLGLMAGVSILRLVLAMLLGASLGKLGNLWAFPLAVSLPPALMTVGVHILRGRRLFNAGFSLADLRTAIARDEDDRADALAVDADKPLTLPRHFLRLATYVSMIPALGSMMMGGVRFWPTVQIASLIGTFVLIGACDINNVPLLPASLRRGRRSMRDRLWTSKLGEWIAKRLGAPEKSTMVSEAAFRPTEVVLGVAAGELFDALPASFRERLPELPSIVEKLEARAATARARLDELAVQEAVGGAEATRDALGEARSEARRALSSTVSSLESIRLDLLRLHAGSTDLSSLTTLLDAASAAGHDMRRLAEGQREVNARLRRRSPLRETSLTPV
ncbi:MAG: serine/threonine-protein kinase [Gemmatimonadota bacterium]